MEVSAVLYKCTYCIFCFSISKITSKRMNAYRSIKIKVCYFFNCDKSMLFLYPYHCNINEIGVRALHNLIVNIVYLLREEGFILKKKSNGGDKGA